MTYKRDFNTTPNQQGEVRKVIYHGNFLGIWNYSTHKIEPVNPPQKGGHLGSRYVYTHTWF